MKTRKLAVLLGVLLLTAWMPHHGTAPNRWALIVGISDYRNFGPEIGGDLPGASWDARRMRDVLIARWGFDADRVRLVLDHDATRDRIERELTEWLPAVAKEGDVVVFFFAGHGSQTWDITGDEEEGLDETICPTDVMKGDVSRDIRDDELNAWLSAVPAQMIVLLDNCNAGSGTRAVTPYARPRALARDVAADVPRTSAPPAGTVAIAPVGSNVLEIAASQAGEVAVDAEWPGVDGAPSTFGGAFTTTLVRNMWRVPRRTSYEDLFHMTAADMARQRFAQQPMLTKTGTETQPFAFIAGADAAAGEGFIPVTGIRGATLELAGGAGAGMTVGSIYDAGGATIRIDAVNDASASGTILRGSAPQAGARATLLAYAYPEAQLRVSLADVNAATRSALTAALRTSSSIRFVTDPREFAHLIVRPAEVGYVVLGMDGATRHEKLASHGDVAAALQREAGAHQLAALDNPGQDQQLEFGFIGGATVFELGADIGFTARAPRAGYLTIVDLGTDGKITVLFPNDPTQNGRVAAGQVFELPTGGDRFKAQEPAGRGIVRAFLTERPLPLEFREGNPEEAGAVLEALRRAAGPAAVAGSTAVPVRTWLTTSVVYTIND